MLLRLFVKINVLVVSDFVCSIAINNVYSYALSIFGYLANLTAISCICNGPYYVLVSFHALVENMVLKIPFQRCITYMPPEFLNCNCKTKKKILQSFSDCISGWSNKPQWTNNCGSFLPCFLLVMYGGVSELSV